GDYQPVPVQVRLGPASNLRWLFDLLIGNRPFFRDSVREHGYVLCELSASLPSKGAATASRRHNPTRWLWSMYGGATRRSDRRQHAAPVADVKFRGCGGICMPLSNW